MVALAALTYKGGGIGLVRAATMRGSAAARALDQLIRWNYWYSLGLEERLLRRIKRSDTRHYELIRGQCPRDHLLVGTSASAAA